MKNIPHFFIFPVFFFYFPTVPQNALWSRSRLEIFPFASAMSILPITALIKHKIAAENHELAIQV